MFRFSADPVKCSKRKNFLFDRLQDLQAGDEASLFSQYELFDEPALATVEAYFMLHDAYKAKRQIPPDHFTEFSKVAAFSAIAIGFLCPLRAKHPHRDSNLQDQMINPMFGVRLALQRVGATLESLSNEEKDRIYQGFRDFKFPALDDFFTDLRNGKRELFDPIDVNLGEQEVIYIEDKITIFALCERLAKCERLFEEVSLQIKNRE
jgi:hypothetical protein